MHKISVGLEGAREAVRSSSTAVIVDALRASSTICSLFQAGASEVMVCDGVETARLVAETVENPILVGEEDSIKPDDFQMSNSPVEVMKADLKGRSVLFTSTNGARLLVACRGAERIFIGSVNNIERLGELLNVSGKGDTIIIAAGDREEQCDEDLASAALIAEEVGPEIAEEQEGLIAYWRTRVISSGLATLFQESLHGKELIELGQGDDVIYAASPDLCPLVPVVEKYCDYKGKVFARLRIERQ